MYVVLLSEYTASISLNKRVVFVMGMEFSLRWEHNYFDLMEYITMCLDSTNKVEQWCVRAQLIYCFKS